MKPKPNQPAKYNHICMMDILESTDDCLFHIFSIMDRFLLQGRLKILFFPLFFYLDLELSILKMHQPKKPALGLK